MDNRILLPCFLMMFIGYLDRQNMANAKVLNAGTPDSIEKVWGLEGAQYSMVISIYGIGLVICEPFVGIERASRVDPGLMHVSDALLSFVCTTRSAK